jgi:hypothetical protein
MNEWMWEIPLFKGFYKSPESALGYEIAELNAWRQAV